jgi:diguanylate cyclase (GGDEF)-like protein
VRHELSELEDNLTALKAGRGYQTFEANATNLVQITADLLNQLVEFYTHNLEKQEVEHQRDTLTQLYTRKHLMENMELEIKRAKRYQHPLSFIMIDIDHFKKFNDEYGHLMGDHVLKQASQLIRENTREVDLVARYGGEEIAVVLMDTPLKHARLVAEKLRVMMEKAEFTYNEQTVHVTISLGVTSFLGGENDTLQAIIQRADEALYEAKNSGRNQVRRKI